MVECKVRFENNTSKIFSSGSHVKGEVEVVLKRPIEIRNILFTMKGVGRVRWAKDIEHQYIEDEEEYVKKVEYLYGSSEGRKETINKGTHIYTFAFLIPPEVPSSFEGEYGSIRYSIKVKFNRQLKLGETFTFPFTVIKELNLNYEILPIRDAHSKAIEKRFCCWPCTSKPLNIEVYLLQSGYVPGQNIQVTINLYNKSGKNIKKLEVFLNKIIIYKIQNLPNEIKTQTTTVNKVILDLIGKSLKETLLVDLLVLSTTQSFSVKIIEVKYELNIRVNMRLPYKSPIVKFPILIGNVPLYTRPQRIASTEFISNMSI